MSRWEPIRLRNALTESYNDGRSIDQIMHEHGLSERTVCDHLDANRAGFGSYRDEAYQEWLEKPRKPGWPQIHSKRSEVPVKVIPPLRAKDRLGGRTEAVGTILCSVCGLVVIRSGKRGRPRTKHKECK